MTGKSEEVSGWVVKGCLITHPLCPHRKLFVFVAVMLSNLILFNKSLAKSINAAFCKIKIRQALVCFCERKAEEQKKTDREEKKLFFATVSAVILM